MRPIGWGLAAALFAAVLAPVAVFSAPKALAPVSDAQRKQGMAEAPAVAQSAGLSCQVSDARFIGKGADPKTKTENSYYEVACGQGMGYVLQAPKGGTPLMQAKQTIGIDLPLKALVWEDADGKVWLSYNDPGWIARRHGATGVTEVTSSLAAGLAALAKTTAGT